MMARDRWRVGLIWMSACRSDEGERHPGLTNLDIALFLGTELTKMMIRMTVTESAPFRCRQGAKQRMVS